MGLLVTKESNVTASFTDFEISNEEFVTNINFIAMTFDTDVGIHVIFVGDNPVSGMSVVTGVSNG